MRITEVTPFIHNIYLSGIIEGLITSERLKNIA